MGLCEETENLSRWKSTPSISSLWYYPSQYWFPYYGSSVLLRQIWTKISKSWSRRAHSGKGQIDSRNSHPQHFFKPFSNLTCPGRSNQTRWGMDYLGLIVGWLHQSLPDDITWGPSGRHASKNRWDATRFFISLPTYNFLKVECVSRMAVDSVPPHAEIGPNDYQEDALHCIFDSFDISSNKFSMIVNEKI